jgi:hypothetical protein|tara:strand:- start:1697 stop:2467 length:771 start_codon:yes stop_codon:yes gene_type:complete
MNQTANFCKYCNKYFHFKDLYDQHVITCEYFYRSKRQKDREDDYIEKLPTPQEQFKLIQYLTLKVNRLETDIARLKINAGTKKRKLVLELLNNPTNPKPPVLFENWYKQYELNYNDLDAVFNGDITDGMMSVLQRYLKKCSNLPICSFNQKQNSIYIWTSSFNKDSNEPIWILLDFKIFLIWVRYINHQFLELFLKWQIENSKLIYSSEAEKERHIASTRKINGLDENYEKKRRSSLHKWIYSQLAKDIDINNEYV